MVMYTYIYPVSPELFPETTETHESSLVVRVVVYFRILRTSITKCINYPMLPEMLSLTQYVLSMLYTTMPSFHFGCAVHTCRCVQSHTSYSGSGATFLQKGGMVSYGTPTAGYWLVGNPDCQWSTEHFNLVSSYNGFQGYFFPPYRTAARHLLGVIKWNLLILTYVCMIVHQY